ncbi:MAG: hypothetical protein JRJ39_03260 [Deltaproteobacteria bacterium]|nr:hypothetical protein [Deltaproteobacteria bacterium]MBW1812712.1 hypothetical protein [Deltaproteobacteria bacterium]MBW1845674.1 hypothetical protein [Deltaproteobacteria bacterium]
MNSKQRSEAVIAGKTPDRLVTLSGWISWPRDLIKLSNLTEEDYIRDRDNVAVTAYQNLGVDGLLGYIANIDLDSFGVFGLGRCGGPSYGPDHTGDDGLSGSLGRKNNIGE